MWESVIEFVRTSVKGKAHRSNRANLSSGFVRTKGLDNIG